MHTHAHTPSFRKSQMAHQPESVNHTHLSPHTYTHTHIHARTHTNTCTHVHTHTHTHKHTHIYTHILLESHKVLISLKVRIIHISSHAQKHTRTYTLTRTHTNTRTQTHRKRESNHGRRRSDLKRFQLPNFQTSFHGNPRTFHKRFHRSDQDFKQIFTGVNGSPCHSKKTRKNSSIWISQYLKSDLLREWHFCTKQKHAYTYTHILSLPHAHKHTHTPSVCESNTYFLSS